MKILKPSPRFVVIVWFVGMLAISFTAHYFSCETKANVITVLYFVLLLWNLESSNRRVQKAENEALDYKRELVDLHQFMQNNKGAQ